MLTPGERNNIRVVRGLPRAWNARQRWREFPAAALPSGGLVLWRLRLPRAADRSVGSAAAASGTVADYAVALLQAVSVVLSLIVSQRRGERIQALQRVQRIQRAHRAHLVLLA